MLHGYTHLVAMPGGDAQKQGELEHLVAQLPLMAQFAVGDHPTVL